MAENPESALSAKLHDLPIKQSLSDMILTIEDLVMSQVCSRIESGQKTIPAERRDLAPAIAKLQTKHAADIERMVRLHRLRETQKIKDHLEQKLTHLQDRIEVLNELEGSPKVQKASLLKKEVRHQFMEQEQERVRETSEFAKKLAEEQRERLRKQRHEARDMRRQAQLEEEKEAELARKQKEENIAHMKEQEKAKFEQLAQKRKEYMQSLAKLPVRKSPNMQRNASMPELERKKKELAEKRKLESWTDVNKHMQDYDEEKKKREERSALEGFMKSSSNQPKFEKSKFLEAVKEEERQRKEEEEREQEEFAKRIEMKKRYGEIIKEMYAPVVDPDLRQKLEQDIAKLHTKARVVQSQANSTRGPPGALNTRTSPVSEHRPKKRKDLSKSQPANEKPVKPIKDYLTEQRRDQDAEAAALLSRLHHSPRSSLDPASDPQSLIVQLAKVDEKTLKKEKLLKRLDVTDPKALAARGDMDSELIASLKTKMALIKSP